MTAHKLPLLVAGTIFLIVSLLHALRFIFKVEVIVNGAIVPPAASVVGCIAALLLGIWMLKSSK